MHSLIAPVPGEFQFTLHRRVKQPSTMRHPGEPIQSVRKR